jgi:hypothetical protein
MTFTTARNDPLLILGLYWQVIGGGRWQGGCWRSLWSPPFRWRKCCSRLPEGRSRRPLIPEEWLDWSESRRMCIDHAAKSHLLAGLVNRFKRREDQDLGVKRLSIGYEPLFALAPLQRLPCGDILYSCTRARKKNVKASSRATAAPSAWQC